MNYGFLNIFKEKGMTSFDVVMQLKRITGIKKIGHTGTLDPLAEGVLVVALGEATKLIEFLTNDEKEYSAEIFLGKESDTYDAEGKITEVSNHVPDLDEINNSLNTFRGEIEQTPPKYSAIKINGRRAYDMARKGEEFEMKKRKINIFNIVLNSYKYPFVNIDITCSGGTYIRSIAHDLGSKLETGAYLSALLRTRCGTFLLSDAIKLADVKEKGFENFLIPLEAATIKHECMEISDEEYNKLNFGQFIEKKDIKSDIVCAFLNNRLIGIIERTQNNLFKYKKKININ